MLSVFLLCLAMFSAAWAYTSMMKSGEFTMGGMPVKYKIILIIYIIVAFFILWAGGPIVFMIYAVIAGIGAACGWFFTKNNTDDNTGKPELRVPVRLQVIDNTNASITDYTRKTNANNDTNSSTDTTTQQSSDTVNNNDNNDNKTQQTTDTNSNASTDTASNSSDNAGSQQANSTDENDDVISANASIANTNDNTTTTTTAGQLESDSNAASDSDSNDNTNSSSGSSDSIDKSSASNHVNTDEHDSDNAM